MAKKSPSPTTLQTLVKLLGISVRGVQKLAEEGIIPRPVGGKYDVVVCTRAYIEHWKRKAAPVKSKTRDDIEQVELQTKQFKLDREKGLYILKEEVGDELSRRIVILKRDFKVLENRLSKYPEAKEIVKKTHYAMMLNYSRRSGPLKGAKNGKK